jgi:hypothetical protein
VDGFGVAVAGQPCGELIGRVEQPGVAGFGREQDKLTNSYDAPIAVSSPSLVGADLVGEAKALPSTICCPVDAGSPFGQRREDCGTARRGR